VDSDFHENEKRRDLTEPDFETVMAEIPKILAA
jgi:hypothetical protein